MSNMPDPNDVYYGLNESIQKNKRPQLMLYAFLTSKSMQSNIVRKTMNDNKAALKLLTSPEGRKWIHYWLDDTLNYLQKFAES